jgi:tetratricopeptide (TPR) repeat protein
MTINLSTIKNSRIYFIITLLTFIIYWNGIDNEYSMDDNLVTEGVAKVEKGLKGIPEIFNTHYSTGKQNYGYRPLVQMTFALEKQVFKKLPVAQSLKGKKRKNKLTQANISHFINIMMYALICIVLFSFLRELLDKFNIILPIAITLLFLVHPLHTEAVDNIKSRDELLMLLNMLFALKFYLKFAIKGHLKYVLIACFFVFLSMLSKKNAMALIGVVPVVLYFKKANYKKIVLATISVVGIFACFILIKKGLVTEAGTRKLKYFENPIRFEGGFMNRITLGLYSSWFYLKMLIFPKEMSFYYGYNQIPNVNWTYWQVWLSLLFYVPLGVYGVWRFLKRDVIGLGIIIWIGIMMGVINVIFPIVGIVADRFAFTFSIGFCIVVCFLILKIFKIDLSAELYKIKLPSSFIMVFTAILVIYSARTIARNPDWHDHMTLYNNDIEHLQESAKAHALLANTYYPILTQEIQNNPSSPENRANIQKLIYHYKEAIRVDSTYITSTNNLGSAYMNFLSDYDNTIFYCEKAVGMDENYLEAHFNLAFSYDAIGDYEKSLYHYSKVIEINTDYMRAYDLFNKVVTKYGKIKEGVELLIIVAEKVDQPKNIYLDIANLYSLDNYNVQQSIVYFIKAYEYDKSDKNLCNHISTLYNSIGDIGKANFYRKQCNP